MGHNGARNFDWTPAAIERLIALHTMGLTPRQIAVGIGGLSRNAVSGKLARLGIALRQRPAAEPRPARLNDGRADTTLLQAIKRDKPPTPSAGVMVDLPPDESLDAVPFMEREPHQCAWPLAKYSHLQWVCGAQIALRSYCDRHAKIAYGTKFTR
jgi:GcrA cell cycle regulator